MTGSKALLHDTDTVLYFAPTQEARLQAMRRANEQASVLVAQALADGEPERRLRVVVGIDQEDMTVKQRGFLHAAVLPQISEQVRMPDGTRYVVAIWKEFFRKLFLPDRFELRAVPRWDAALGRLVQPKRATPQRVRVSTEDLSIKQYSNYIDQVIAHATTEFNVAFRFIAEEREAVQWRPARKAPRLAVRQPQSEGAVA